MALDAALMTHPLMSTRAQGHSVGDRDYGPDGVLYRWSGASWDREPAHMQGGAPTNAAGQPIPSAGDGSYFTAGGGGGGGAGTAPPFKFDWEAARKAAFDPEHPENSVLGRYYLQKLKDAGNDVVRAKRLMEEDYNRGVRIASEDYTRTEKYGQEDLTSQLAQFGIESIQERQNTLAGANRRGTLLGQIPQGQDTAKAPYSDYAREYIINPMEQKQALRKQAIERAIQRQTEIARVGKERETEKLGVEKTRGFEEQNIQYPRTQSELQEQTRKEAYNIQVPQQYQEQYAKYRAASNLG